MAHPGGNPLLKELVAQRPPTNCTPIDKGKRPRTEPPSRAEQVPENVEPITILLPPQQQTALVPETHRHKKRKDKEHKKDKSRCSPTKHSTANHFCIPGRGYGFPQV